MKNYYIGYSDEICKLTKKLYHDIRHLHLNSVGVVIGDNFSDAVVHLVGRWWNCEGAIEIRYALLDAPNVTFIKHLTVVGSQAESRFPLSRLEDAARLRASLLVERPYSELVLLTFASLQSSL